MIVAWASIRSRIRILIKMQMIRLVAQSPEHLSSDHQNHAWISLIVPHHLTNKWFAKHITLSVLEKRVQAAMIVSVGLDETMLRKERGYSKISVKQKWVSTQTNSSSSQLNRVLEVTAIVVTRFGASTILGTNMQALLAVQNSCWACLVAKQLLLMPPIFKNSAQKTKTSKAMQAHQQTKSKKAPESSPLTLNSPLQGVTSPISNWKIKLKLATSEFQRQSIRFLRILAKQMKLESKTLAFV